MIPEDATHKWIPAVENQWVLPYVFQRAYYKKIDGVWYSYSIDNTWIKSGNDAEWFDEGVRLGEFVEVV